MRDGPDPVDVRIDTTDKVKTNRLNGIDKRPDGLLSHTILGVDSIDDLYMLKKRSRDKPALKDTLTRIMVAQQLTAEFKTYLLPGRGFVVSRLPDEGTLLVSHVFRVAKKLLNECGPFFLSL